MMYQSMTRQELEEELVHVKEKLSKLEDLVGAASGNGGHERLKEKRYKKLFEESRDAVTITNEKGVIEDANDAALQLFGFTRSQMVGLNFRELYEDPITGRKLVNELAACGAVKDFEARLVRNDNIIMDCLLTVTARTNESGSVMGFHGMIRDVSERKAALEALRESEERFRSLSEYSPDIIYTLNHEGAFNYVNPAWEKILGHKPSEVLGRFFTDFVKPDTATFFRRRYKNIRDEKAILKDIDGVMIARDGSEHHFSMSGAPNFNAEGRIVGMVGLLKDITSRIKAENDLKIQKAYAEELIDGAPEAVLILDTEDRVLRVNKEFTRLFGYTPEEAAGRKVNDLLVPDHLKDEGVDYTMRAASGERLETESKRMRKDGELVDVSILATPIRVEGGQIGVYAIYRDITARKKTQNALRDSEEKYGAILENIEDGFYELDFNGNFTFATEVAANIVETPRDEFIGKNFADFCDESEARRLFKVYNDIFITGRPMKQVAYRIILPNGQRKTLEASASLIMDADGRKVGFRGIMRDMTARLNAQRALRESEEKYRTILDNIQEGYFELDLSGNFVFFNDSMLKISGETRESLMGVNYMEYTTPETSQRMFKVFNNMFKTSEPATVTDYEVIRKDGTKRTIELTASLKTNKEGMPSGFRAVARDVTDRNKVLAALRESEERHRTVLETAPDPVIVRDVDGFITYVNPAFTRVFGWTLDECGGTKLAFIPDENVPENLEMLEKIKRGRTFSGIETRRLTKNGDIVDVSISGAVFFNADGEPQGNVVTLQDITERKKAEDELKFVAFHDLLTGLPNRKSFYMCLEDTLTQTRRRKTENMWALLFLDLDRFKQVNDTLGHDVGDVLLKAVAERVNKCLRESDHFFRLGGDEFTVIITNLNKGIDVAKVADKIRREVAKPFKIKKHEIYTSASIGISVFPTDGADVEVLVKNADMAMYAAKEEKDGYRFYTEEMNRKALERMKLEGALRNAVERDELVLFYQPLVDNQKNILGMEALLRWRHPELGLVPPDQFIPVAEETGAIVPIGTWVLEAACRKVKEWQTKGHEKLFVAVNLSPRQFREPDLVETVFHALNLTGLEPNYLKLEITESSVMDDPEGAIAKMEELKKYGISFAIDDFGTGYSSLSYLKRFPIDTLKIDRSFVTDSMQNRDDQEIIKTIISMAQNLRIETVAEGVETQEQLDFLCSQGCSKMQGYLFSKPLCCDEFEKLLVESNNWISEDICKVEV